MSDKKMSVRLFVSLTNRSIKMSSEAFLAAHREWLSTGELADKASPILAKIDSNELFPTVGLQAIKNAAYDHIIKQAIAKAEADLNKPAKVKGVIRSDKPYQACIKNADGTVAIVKDDDGEERELRANFDHSQQAERWCQRRLNEGMSDWSGEFIWTKVLDKNGNPFVTSVSRQDAIYAMRKIVKTPFMHVNKTSASPKNQKMKVAGKHHSASHG